MSDNSGMSWWQGLIGARGAAAETSTRETTQTSVETKVLIQLLSGLTLAFVAVPGTAFGGWLTIRGFASLLDVRLTGLDVALALTVLSVLALTVRQIVAGFAARTTVSGGVRSLFSLLMVAVVVGISVYAWGRAEREPDFGTTLSLLFGPSMVYGFSLLAYNMTMQLREPFGFESPFERRYLDLYERQLFPDDQGRQVRVLEIRSERGEFVTSDETLGLSEEDLVKFARELARDWNLAESRWGKAPPFESYPQYRATRAVMERQGLARKTPTGFEITPRGRIVFRRLAE